MIALPTTPSAAQEQPGRCANGGDYGTTLTTDTTWSQDVYLGRNLTIRNATLTIEPGVTVYFCGLFNLKIGDLFAPGRLLAVGTPEQPITFRPITGVEHWGWLYFEDALPEASLLQHALILRGGGTSPSNPDSAVIYISNRHSQAAVASPVIEHVLVEQSAANGIFIYPNVENDPTPAALARVTITGSARAPIRMAAAAASGLGEGIVTSDNVIERLQILGDNLLGMMYYDQFWRAHATPYEILGSLTMRNRDPEQPFSTWRIAPGATLLIHENRNLTIGGLSSPARLIAEGTAENPIILTRANPTVEQWGNLRIELFNTADQQLRWVELLHGGGPATPEAEAGVLSHAGTGMLTVEHLTIKFSKNAAFYAGGNARLNRFQISNSWFELNRLGLNLWDTRGQVRASRFVNQSEEAIRNNRAAQICLDAVGNWWGAPEDPQDGSASTNDACAPAGRTNPGTGSPVSDGVRYWPWLSDQGGVPQDRSSITPDGDFLPLRNTNPEPVEVEVAFRVSDFGIGQQWTPVVTRSQTIAPGEIWNAQGGYIPPDTAHRCVAYEVNFMTMSGQIMPLRSGRFGGQRNPESISPPPAPPKRCNPDATKLIPRGTGLKGVRKHFKNLRQQNQQVICVLNRDLSLNANTLAESGRNYQELVTLRSFVPQPLLVDDEVTPAQAAASTKAAEAIALLNGLDLAIIETYARMVQASRAQDWQAALRQTEAYRGFQLQRAEQLDRLATALDELVAANLAAGLDPLFSPAEYAAYQDELRTSGYDAETIAFRRASGFSNAEIAEMLAIEIATLEAGLPTASTSLNENVRELAAESRATAQALRRFLQPIQSATGDTHHLTTATANPISFVVGNPTENAATVELVVRPVDLPLHWQVRLDQATFQLDAGEQIRTFLTLDPGGQAVLQDTEVQVAVEGYINGELIGGILVRQHVPSSAAGTTTVFVPLIRR
ncbi:MAG: hypothetical protein AB4911_06305 [Oscillochloridaceae bacterium umkhey_bin13]